MVHCIIFNCAYSPVRYYPVDAFDQLSHAGNTYTSTMMLLLLCHHFRCCQHNLQCLVLWYVIFCQQVRSLQEWVVETDIGVHGTPDRLTDPSDRHGPCASL